MAEQIYYSVFTKQGLALLTEAIQNGTKLGITSMAFGDGGGSLPVPNENFTSMVREVHRTQLNSLAPDPNNANWLRADAIIASATGGFNIRELGLYAGNVLVAYSNYPPTYKPNPSDGTARIMSFRMILQIDNTANFDLVIDPDVVLATIQKVEDTKLEILNTIGNSTLYPLLKPGVQHAVTNYTLLQEAAKTGSNIELPNGIYYISDAINLTPGQIITGKGMPFGKSLTSTMLINVNEGGGVFFLETEDSSGTSIKAPNFNKFGIQADNPIILNSFLTSTVSDISINSNVPYLLNSTISEMYIIARKHGVGLGIQAAKLFDSKINNNYIANFSINIALLGSDMNAIKENRLMGASRFHILDLSADSFGSQNNIYHNDILDMNGDDTSVYIKTTSRHCIIKDNYLESTKKIKGFIDASYADMPQDLIIANNANTSGSRFSTDIADNRIDGLNQVTDFGYRYQPDGQIFGKILDKGTVQPESPAPKLLLIDNVGNKVNSLPVAFNKVNLANFEFSGSRFNEWDGFKTTNIISNRVTVQNIQQFGSTGDLTLNYNLRDVYPYLRLKPSSFILQSELKNTLYLLYPKNSQVFKYQKTNTLKLKIKTIGSASEQITFGFCKNESKVASKVITVGPTFQEFEFRFYNSSWNDNDGKCGAFISRNSNLSDLEIEYVEIGSSYQNEVRIAQRNIITLELNNESDIIISATDSSSLNKCIYIFKYIDGTLIQSASSVSDKSKIDITYSITGQTANFNLIGSSAQDGRMGATYNF